MTTIKGFIPCTVPVLAVFTDGKAYSVISWAIIDLNDDDDNGDGPMLALTGMILSSDSALLETITYFGSDFSHYVG